MTTPPRRGAPSAPARRSRADPLLADPRRNRRGAARRHRRAASTTLADLLARRRALRPAADRLERSRSRGRAQLFADLLVAADAARRGALATSGSTASTQLIDRYDALPARRPGRGAVSLLLQQAELVVATDADQRRCPRPRPAFTRVAVGAPARDVRAASGRSSRALRATPRPPARRAARRGARRCCRSTRSTPSAFDLGAIRGRACVRFATTLAARVAAAADAIDAATRPPRTRRSTPTTPPPPARRRVAALAGGRAAALLGEDVAARPRVRRLGAEHGDEWRGGAARQPSGAPLAASRTRPRLPGRRLAARRRARARAAARTGSRLCCSRGALGAGEPELTPIQLPYRPGDRGSALEFPPEHDDRRRAPALHRALRGAVRPGRSASAACCSTSGPR